MTPSGRTQVALLDLAGKPAAVFVGENRDWSHVADRDFSRTLRISVASDAAGADGTWAHHVVDVVPAVGYDGNDPWNPLTFAALSISGEAVILFNGPGGDASSTDLWVAWGAPGAMVKERVASSGGVADKFVQGISAVDLGDGRIGCSFTLIDRQTENGDQLLYVEGTPGTGSWAVEQAVASPLGQDPKMPSKSQTQTGAGPSVVYWDITGEPGSSQSELQLMRVDRLAGQVWSTPHPMVGGRSQRAASDLAMNDRGNLVASWSPSGYLNVHAQAAIEDGGGWTLITASSVSVSYAQKDKAGLAFVPLGGGASAWGLFYCNSTATEGSSVNFFAGHWLRQSGGARATTQYGNGGALDTTHGLNGHFANGGLGDAPGGQAAGLIVWTPTLIGGVVGGGVACLCLAALCIAIIVMLANRDNKRNNRQPSSLSRRQGLYDYVPARERGSSRRSRRSSGRTRY